ncbi:MAG: PAS domain-containing protein [Gammaproteobacteria bacterium]|nr:PAS domain-containing protein [Gammaproteobacteria bacterium]MDH5799696.1 PAS domain-containing protein [Gammaproteobacteria bacterium]
MDISQINSDLNLLTILNHAVNQHAIISMTDKDGAIIYVNELFCQVSGYSKKELLGKNHNVVRSQAHDTRFYQDLWRTITQGKTWEGVIQNRRKDGQPYWVQSTIVPILDNHKKPIRYISVRTDVTQRERMRDAMERMATADTSHDAFNAIAKAICIGLDCRSCLIAQFVTQDTQTQIIGSFDQTPDVAPANGTLSPVLPHSIAAHLLNKELSLLVNNAAHMYPDDPILTRQTSALMAQAILDNSNKVIGLICATSGQPFIHSGTENSLLKLAAKRTSLELRRAEFEHVIREREQMLAAAQRLAKLGSWILDYRNGSLHWSEEVYRIFELDPKTTTPSYELFLQMVHPDDRELVQQAYDNSLQDRNDYSVLHRLCLEGKREKWLHERGETSFDSQGHPIRSIGYVHDVTERKLIEKELRDSEQRFDISQTFGNIGSFEWNIVTNQVLWSTQMWSILGLDRSIPPSFDAYIERVHPDDVDILQKAVLQCVETATDVDITYRLIHPGGELHWVRGRANIQHNGETKRMLGIIIDIDKQKLAEDEQSRLQTQLQQAQKMESIGQLAAGIAHDFNNMLSTIVGYTDLCKELYVDPQSKPAQYLNEVLKAAEQGRNLVQQMLTFGRAAPGHRKAVLAGRLLKEICKLLHATLPSRIALKPQVEQECHVLSDPVQLHQVVTNLILNARDALGPHGDIRLILLPKTYIEGTCSSCAQPFRGDFVEICVEDNGHGISEDNLTHIFEPFFSTKQMGKGSGMGLPMVHGILHQQDNHIIVESQLGQGTKFRLFLQPALENETTITPTKTEKPLPQTVSE